MLRVETARRFIAETENKLIFVGDANYKIYGLLNTPGITLEDVAQGAFSGTPAQKKQWINKTPQEILADLRKAKTTVRQQGLFNPDTLVLPPEQYDMLDQPYSSESTMTIRMWLGSQGLNFPKVFPAKELSKDYNSLSVDAFLLMDSNPQVAEIAITRDMELLPPVYDIVGNSEQVVIESLAGVIVRYPKAIYVGKGI